MPRQYVPIPMPLPSGRLAGATRTVYFRRRLPSGRNVLLGPVDAHIYSASADALRTPEAAKYKWALIWWSEAMFDDADIVRGHERPEEGDQLLSDFFLLGDQFEDIELGTVNTDIGAFVVMTSYFMEVAGQQTTQTVPRGVN